jgi:hypothetical protein
MADVAWQEAALMLVVVRIGMHAPNTSRGELVSNRLELAGNNGSCRNALLVERSGA